MQHLALGCVLLAAACGARTAVDGDVPLGCEIEPGSWTLETVDTNGNAFGTDWAAPYGEVVHAGYVDHERDGSWLLATHADRWTIEPVTSEEADFGPIHVRVGPDHEVHVLHSRGDWYDTHGIDGAWTTEDVSLATGNASFDLDEAGTAHVVVGTGEGAGGENQFRYRTNTSGAWTGDGFELPCGSGRLGSGPATPSLDVDSDDVIHLAVGCDQLFHAVRTEDGWSIEIVDPGPFLRAWPSMAVGADGRTRIAYTVALSTTSVPELRYASDESGSWKVETLSRPAGEWVSLALDEADAPHIAHLDQVPLHLGYFARSADGWHRQTIDPDPHGGLSPSIFLSESAVHVAYEGAGNEIRYATARCRFAH